MDINHSNELKRMSEELKEVLTGITNINKRQYDYEQKNGKELADLKESQVKAINDFQVKLEKGEKLQKDLEKAYINYENSSKIVTAARDLKKFNNIMKSYDPKFNPITNDEFSELKRLEEKFIRRGINSITEMEHKALNTIIDPEGGLFVLPEYASNVEKKEIEPHGIMGLITRVRTSSNPYKHWVDWYDWDKSEYVNELDALAEPETPQFLREVTIPVTSEYYGAPFSREILMDSQYDIQNHVINRLREGLEDKTGTFVITGNGVDKPRGILTYTDGTGFGEIKRVESAQASTLVWDDVLAYLPRELKSKYDNGQNTAFVMKKRSFYLLILDKDGSQRYQVANQVNFFTGAGISLAILGSPVIWEPAMPDVADNAASVAYGDFKRAYHFTEREGETIHRNDSDPKKMTITLSKRNGGGIVNSEAIVLLKIKAA